MKNVQTSWKESRDVGNDRTRRLHALPRTAPRPKWGALYVALGVVAVAGTGAHFLAMDTALVRLVDAGFGFALFVTLAGWVHLNGVAIVQGADPEAVAAPTKLRIVRSRVRAPEDTHADDGVIRLAPDERVVLPYDFR
jgi:hypothetical protein